MLQTSQCAPQTPPSVLLAMALAPGSLCTHAQPLLSSRTNVSFVVEHYFFFFNEFYLLFIWFLAMLGLQCCMIFSCCQAGSKGAQASVVGAYELSFSMWNLPGPGIKPISSALAGRFLTTGPPGKSRGALLLCCIPYRAVHPVRMGITPLILHVPSVPWVMVE